jgi:hypothetical protein
MTPGLHYGIPAEDYHADEATPEPALTAGFAIDLIRHTPARAWARKYLRKDDEDTQQMIFGTAAHLAVLEPDRFQSQVAVLGHDDWRKKAAKEERDAHRAAGRIVLLEKEAEVLADMALAMRNALDVPFTTAPDICSGLFEGGNAEVTIICAGLEDVLPWRKVRPDYVKRGDEYDFIVDYKTTGFAGRNIDRLASTDRWDMRAAFYMDAYRTETGRDSVYVYLVQETKPPHFVQHYLVPSSELAEGARDVSEATRVYMACRKERNWPSHVNDVRMLNIFRG